jgi:acyl transferase domain-containing protein
LLPVNYGFHTVLMDPFEQKIKQFIRAINLLSADVPVISSNKAK